MKTTDPIADAATWEALKGIHWPDLPDPQICAIYRLIRSFVDLFFHGSEYEIKGLDIEPTFRSKIRVFVEVGRKNDAGTAAVFCRKWTNTFVGPRGGSHAYRKKMKGRGSTRVTGLRECILSAFDH